MNAIKLQLFLLLINIFYMSDCLRRIQGGDKVTSKKSYMVYLVKSPKSVKSFEHWLCGGVLVNPWYIVTAQDCVNDIEYMYAIAGYDTYVTDAEIEVDNCTREKKKKVVYYCVPELYEKNAKKWSLIDIALVKVESPYDFNDETYKELCSYTPSSIPINFDQRFQKPGMDGLVLGWGHTDNWRQPEDKQNYNKKYLRYASVRIMDKEMCKQQYKQYSNMDIDIIENYMICTSEKGELDENGKIVLVGDPQAKVDGCAGDLKLLGSDNEPCDEDQQRHRAALKSNPTNDSNITKNDSNIKMKNKTLLNKTKESRKSGFCQNDHGGPLVTWVGAREVLIGIAAVFRVSDDSKCIGPYLYTSTVCNSAFLDCVLSDLDFPNKTRRRDIICDSPPIQRGYYTIEKHFSWKDHPAGAADNEVLVSDKNLAVDRLNTKPGLSNALEGFIKLDDETIAVRPQQPLVQ